MRRIMMVLTVALVMAAMMVAMAMPAFADHSSGHLKGQTQQLLTAFCQELPERPGASECPAPDKAQGPK